MERKSVEASAATYVVYYCQHMAREEAELFPRVDSVLSKADWKAVHDAITAETDPLFGDKVGKRYQHLHRQIMLASRGTDINA